MLVAALSLGLIGPRPLDAGQPPRPDPALARSTPATESLQALVRAAAPGSAITVPPGIYRSGLIIDKSLKVSFAGARLWGVYGGKGVLNVKCDACRVVVEDLVVEGGHAGCTGGNCAGIKAEGRDFHLTVRRAHIDGTVMGILTDNRGGTLILEDSVIQNTGAIGRPATLAHGIYAGLIDRLIVRRSVIRNANADGHLIKSRARLSRLEDTSVLGLQGRHSRSIDLPCGGAFEVEDTVIQHGENTDNTDVIAIGTEPANCGSIRPASVSITDSWMIVERDRSEDERARDSGPSYLFRWRAPIESLRLAGNRIVNLQHWFTRDSTGLGARSGDLSASNTLCPTRKVCGLEPGQLP